MTAKAFAYAIWNRDNVDIDPSDFTIPLDSAISMMEKYSDLEDVDEKQELKSLKFYRDSTVGLFATDRPDKVVDPHKMLFKLEYHII